MSNRSISSGVITVVSRVSIDGMRVRVWKDGVCVAATEVWGDDMYVVMCDVAGTCEDGKCVVLGCVTEVWKDGACVAATEVWEDGVCAVLCCVTGVWEAGVCAVLCCRGVGG